MSNKEPIFEVREIVDGGFGRTYRIWADGRTEGFEFRHVILNMIPVMSDYKTAIALEKREQDLLSLQQRTQCRLVMAYHTALRLGSSLLKRWRLVKSKG